jgi:catalase-peroxidase
LLDINTKWKPVTEDNELFEGSDVTTGEKKWSATRCDLVFGSNLQLRAVCDVYGASTGHEKFVNAFVKAWHKVMMLDRFELQNERYRK